MVDRHIAASSRIRHDLWRHGSRSLLIAMLSAVVVAQDETVIRTRVNVVLVPVVVRDPGGRAVGNLTKDDFEVFDKGKRQTISSFSVVEHASGAPKNEPATDVARGGSAPSIEGHQSRPERYIVYVFDDLNPLFSDLARLREAAARHFRGEFRAADRAAIATFSGRTTLAFTAAPTKLEDAVMKLRLRPSWGHGAGTPCPDVSYYLADLIINGSDARALDAATQQTIACAHVGPDVAKDMALAAAKQELLIGAQDTRVALETLRRAIRLLADCPGQRLIVLASGGFYVLPDEVRDLATVFDLAAKANVNISALDTRGLYLRDPFEANRSKAATSVEQQYYRLSDVAAGDVLAELAEGTGGTFFHNNNDLNLGLARAAAPPEHSYVLGFSPANLKTDGSFHRLRIRLVNQRGVAIQARHGYYALKPASVQEAAAAEMHDAVFSQEEITDIPVDVAMQVLKSGTDNARLTIVAKVHMTWLHFRKVAERSRDSLTVVSAVFDGDGAYVAGMRKTVNLALRDETLAGGDPGVNVQSDFDMKPGTYRVRVVVREAAGKATSAYNGSVTIR